MLEALLQWDTLQKILLNTLLVSIPEEFYVVMFTLTIMGEFDYWDEPARKKLINIWDYPRIIIPVIATSLVSNVLRYIGFEFGIGSLIPVVVLYVTIVLTNDITNDAKPFRWMGRALGSLSIALIILGLSELVYTPFLINGTGKTIEQINNDIWRNFLSALPSKVIVYSALAYVIVKRRTLLKGNVFKCIAESRFLSVTILFIVAFDLFFVYAVYNLTVYWRLLANLSHFTQVLVIITVVLFPLLNISAFIWVIYYVKNKEMQDKKVVHDSLNRLFSEIMEYTNEENYDNLKWKLNEIGADIGKIAGDLYNSEKKEKS